MFKMGSVLPKVVTKYIF